MSSHVFPGVSLALLERLAARTSNSNYSLQISEDQRSGTASGRTPLGDVELRFDFVPEEEVLTLTIVRKPVMVPAPLFWAEFRRILREAAG